VADSVHEPTVVRSGDGSAAWLTLSRPGSLNALNRRLLDELATGLDEAFADPAVRVIVLAGSGDRAFCAGADLDELADLDSAAALELLSRGQSVFRSIERSDKPVIAAVDGFALGGGFELALACHLVVATDRAQFGLPEATLGLIPGYGGTQRLTAAAGRQTALRVMLTGTRLTAAEADRAGLLAVPPVAPGALVEMVGTLVEQLGRATAPATGAVLAAVRDTAVPPALALSHEAALAAIAISSESGRSGIRAFLERSKAQRR
jgi:enoyl-CoA hydratase